ncbi:TRAP transporter subunit DctM [Escherichia coli]|nr:TRAP transporter subunit DctM [Escherichia coli]
MEERGFITRLIKFITIRIFVLLGEIAQFNTCLVILVPNIGRANNRTNRFEIRVGACFVAIYIVTEGVNNRVSGNDSNLLIVFYVQIMPDDFVMQLHRF